VDTAAQGFRVNSSQFGVVVSQASTDAINIASAGDDGVQVSSANYGLYLPSIGVTGVLIPNAGSNGVYANSNDGAGGFFSNNNNDDYALTAYNGTGTGSTVRGLYVQGHGYATGGWLTWLADGGQGYAMLSPEPTVVASGSARLADGAAEVAFDRTFSRALAAEPELHITVTPTEQCLGLWVSSKSGTGFQVESADRSQATFDWIAVGRKSSTAPAPATKRGGGK
jgi:hypothetical protein